MKKSLFYLILISLLSIPCFGLNVNVGGSWPSDADVNTMSPSVASTWMTTQSNSSSILSQTFTATESGTLDKIAVYIKASNAKTYSLRLVDLGVQTSIVSSYSAGTNLLCSSDSLSWTSSNLSSSSLLVVEFDFTGTEEVALIAGHTYAFEILGAVTWGRTTSTSGNIYTGGDLYGGTSTGSRTQTDGRGRDAMMAVTIVPEPATLALLGIGLALLRRKSGK